MKMKTKTMGMFALLMVALTFVGFTYATWKDYVQIEGTVKMGELIVGVLNGTVTTGDTEDTSGILTLSDAELYDEFAYEWGPGTLTAKIDVPGSGVQFDFTGLSPTSGTGVGDNFPVSSKAGGKPKTYGFTQPFTTDGDFSMYREYQLNFTNVGTKAVKVNIKINTGWTIPPPEYAAMWRDTYWQNDWIDVGVGESKILTLYFCSAEVYNALDEKEFMALPDGTKGVAMWRTDEVSEIGLQVLGDGEGSIVVSAMKHYTPKYIASCTAVLSNFETSKHHVPAETVAHTMTITVNDAYPCYHQWIRFNLKNAGTIPAVIVRCEIYDPNGELKWDEVQSVFWKDFNHDNTRDPDGNEDIINLVIWKYDYQNNRMIPLVGNQIDPCTCEWVWIWLHFKEPAEECHTYTFKIHIEAWQWNKYVH